MSLSPGVKGAVLGLWAAALFGLSAPVAKLLLPSSTPLVLASLLYLGGGLGLTGLGVLRRLRPSGVTRREARLGRKDVPLLLGVILCGGVLGPVLMLVGLQRLTGVAASLLLNLEGPFTILLALLVFGEHLGRAGALGRGLHPRGRRGAGLPGGRGARGRARRAGAGRRVPRLGRGQQPHPAADPHGPRGPRARQGTRLRSVHARPGMAHRAALPHSLGARGGPRCSASPATASPSS